MAERVAGQIGADGKSDKAMGGGRERDGLGLIKAMHRVDLTELRQILWEMAGAEFFCGRTSILLNFVT